MLINAAYKNARLHSKSDDRRVKPANFHHSQDIEAMLNIPADKLYTLLHLWYIAKLPGVSNNSVRSHWEYTMWGLVRFADGIYLDWIRPE